MYSSALDGVGVAIVATVLFGFAVWLGVFFVWELILRILNGPLPQERSLMDFEREETFRRSRGTAPSVNPETSEIHGGAGIHEYHVSEKQGQRVADHRHGNVIHRRRLRDKKKSA